MLRVLLAVVVFMFWYGTRRDPFVSCIGIGYW